MVGNLVLRRCVSGSVKRDFRTYIRRYTSPNENFEYGYPLNIIPENHHVYFSDSETILQVYQKGNQSTPQKTSRDCTKFMTSQPQNSSNSVYQSTPQKTSRDCTKFMTPQPQTTSNCVYKCKTCGKGFNFPSHLERHNRIHTGIKPYACEFCDRRCTTKANLQSHLMTHYNDLE